MPISARSVMSDIAQQTSLLKEVTDKERTALQTALTDFMKEVHDVCVRYGLTPYLCYGTALGAVRHHGFIPWDDDIDIAMFRDDWEKFKSIFEKELGEKYDLEAPGYKDEDTKTLWGKIYKKGTELIEVQDVNTPYHKGIFIDVFIIENVSKYKLVRYWDHVISIAMQGIATSMTYYRYPNELMKTFMSSNHKAKIYYFMRRTLGFLFSFVSHKKWAILYDRFISRHKKEFPLVTIPFDYGYYLGGIKERTIWQPAKTVPFGDYSFCVPNDVKSVLKKTYGDDYMTLPPVERREKHFVVSLKL